MAAIANFHLADFLDSFISLALAFGLGTLIGAERQYRQRNAGLRTNALVSLGAASFVDLGNSLTGSGGAVHVLAYVASGVGFLGAGVILKEGMNIRGLNTAATLWCSAATGACAGADRAAEALLIALFTLASNTCLRPLIARIERAPAEEGATEATWVIHVTCREQARDEVRDLVMAVFDVVHLSIREIETDQRSDEEIEFVFTLSATSVSEKELDELVKDIERHEDVLHATWTSTTID